MVKDKAILLRIMKRIVFAFITPIVLLATYTPKLYAQEIWDLRKCVEYAIENNVSVKQSEISQRQNELIYQQSRDGRWPTLNFQSSAGEQWGRNIDPTSNQFITNAIFFSNLSLQTGVTLFNWFGIKNQVESNKLSYESSVAQTKKLQDDIALNVAAAYLQAVLSNEQKKVADLAAAQTAEQLRLTRLRVEAGTVPELNAAELEAQLARDSATIIGAESTYRLNVLSLKAVLNLDAAYPLEVEVPDVNQVKILQLAELSPDYVYQQAVKVRPQLEANKLQYEALGYTAKAARAALYPTIGAFGNIQSAYSSALQVLPKGENVVTVVPTPAFVNVQGQNYFVNSPVSRPTDFVNATYWRQLNNNFRQGIGLSLQVPIFNGHQAKTNYQRALLQQENFTWQMRADSLQLKQDIYSAYQNARNALATYTSRRKALETAQYSLSLGKQRYDVGLLPVFELITLQNNVLRANVDQLTAQYDYIFRTLILQFYQGSVQDIL